MLRRMFLSKIHRAVVTEADLDYEGSVTIDQDLMDAAGMLDFEEVHLWNITRGTRLVTYAIPGDRGSGTMCVNGAAAHLARPGDLVIVATFGELTDEEARRTTSPGSSGWTPRTASWAPNPSAPARTAPGPCRPPHPASPLLRTHPVEPQNGVEHWRPLFRLRG